ncbi:helix-turn-helix domain-containing protein [Scytonema sp. NUACC26]|uniref:helix-turn-helix domain-containing protein n=1 Tax=Scytonema sp. NUACC26 TaxID=3140176 RepID=UPI0034DBDCE9
MQKQGVSLAEAARRLGVSQSTLYVAVQKGQISAFRRYGRTVISTGALRDYQVRQRPTTPYRL